MPTKKGLAIARPSIPIKEYVNKIILIEDAYIVKLFC